MIDAVDMVLQDGNGGPAGTYGRCGVLEWLEAVHDGQWVGPQVFGEVVENDGRMSS